MTATQDPDSDSPTAADGLNDAERDLLEAAATSDGVDLQTGDADLDNPANAADWDDDRNVRADFLADLLTGDQPTESGRLRFVMLRGARITGTLDLQSRKLLCPVMLQDCYFDEAVNLYEAEGISVFLPGCHVPGLNASQLRTTGTVYLGTGFTARGELQLSGARIGGMLVLSGATLNGNNGDALDAGSITVDQKMVCRDGFTARGPIRLASARISGQLDFSGATLTGNNSYALAASQLAVGGDLLCGGGFSAQGEVRLPGARIGGTLLLSGATLNGNNGDALSADGLTVDQRMLCDGFTARGEVRLLGAHIGGALVLSGATLTGNGRALSADGLTVDQSALCGGLTAQGEVRLPGARIGMQLDFSGATLANDNGDALNADSITVDQSVFCRDGFTARGPIRLASARIGRQLDFSGATLTGNGPALTADGLTVDQSLLCRGPFVARGEIRLPGARIGIQLDFRGATLTSDNGPALRADSLTVDQSMLCDDGFTAQGGVDLTNARVGTFYDDQDSWPDELWIRGFTYDRLGNQGVGTRARLHWLRRHAGPFTPGIYDQLADVYRRAGDEGAARKVAVAKQWRRRKPYNPLSWLWWVTVGYGYRTWQAFIWAAVLTFVGALVFSGAYPAHMAALTAHPPRFQPVIYTLDVLLPIGGLGQKSAWQATGGCLDWYWGLAIAGWVLSAAVVAGLTGILKRD